VKCRCGGRYANGDSNGNQAKRHAFRTGPQDKKLHHSVFAQLKPALLLRSLVAQLTAIGR